MTVRTQMCIRDSLNISLKAGLPGPSRVKPGQRKALPVEPVSYTHLDVYKRQL